ncbi:triphosphoribosyl-dephospho-CoA synthase [Pseudomonas matsuisoli]|uniref:Probable 2-(5''-triphosphoribosyl)-3'-dephosphocoenzyme-A synthase n=1 Tax=Pseudomonas matsuisoli TaxID=1515666 RepID=A0A917V027_9PSED|nr:triphosphoribosyl-dephospho-CoA synthase [Pseudomonas matsuisoli]GGK03405.1 putative 2-(5''-triphosphoribosyl)-3'-dephosphocoenzyme-A synthase [Pseudomonas matsuisoli]
MMSHVACLPLPKRCEWLADLAVDALIEEANLSPKPGLVDRRGSGAHRDLDLPLMQASALSLWETFRSMAEAAHEHVDLDSTLRETLGALGRQGERTMLATTAGVNTHRGAIWALGLLVAAAACSPRLDPTRIAERAAHIARIPDRGVPPAAASHGQSVCARFGVDGAREQAQQGFPAVIEHGLPVLNASRAGGHAEHHARLDALLAIMTQLSDTCVLHRGGLHALRQTQAGARAVLDAGGSASFAGRRALQRLDDTLLALNASPGGAADLLAATLLLDGLQFMPADIRSE